jgi:diguanylate cyclase (GGDEF)-like protein/PAS domain S-box-containing protein
MAQSGFDGTITLNHHHRKAALRAIRDATSAVRRWPRGRVIARVALLGLIAVLIGLPGFGLWAAMTAHRAGQAASEANGISDALNAARYSVAAEESLNRKYRLQPSEEVLARHAAAAASVVASLERAGGWGFDHDSIRDLLALHAQYLTRIARMFAAIDAADLGRANSIDESEVDPVFDNIERQVDEAARENDATTVRDLDELLRVQTIIMISTPLVLLLGAGLIAFFWRVLRSSQRRAEMAIRHEAAATRDREHLFRALVQNTSDVILICTASGAVTYQSPAAEAGWGYAADELLDQAILTLAHPDAQPALHELWRQVRDGDAAFSAGTARGIELQMRDSAGDWRHAQMILTNLLHEPAVAGVVVTIRDIHERKAFERQLTQQAFHDSLTGLPNRLLLHDRLRQALMRAIRRGTRVAVLFLDLDNFKLINDGLGHAVGDELLVQAAARLRSCIRAEDTLARLGGDEFVVVLEHLTCEADAIPVALSITKEFGRVFALGGRDLTVTVSMGIALSEAGPEEADNLLRDADVALYRAKSDGKARHVVFDASMRINALARLELEHDLRYAIAKDELRVHYQPIVSMASAHVGEMEALVRWQHPTQGLLPPANFIAIAEESGLIVPLGQWVLQEACRQVAAWHAEFPTDPPLMLSVNLSPRQFQSSNLVEEVARTLRETKLQPGSLKLEITEGVIMRDVEATIGTLSQLKELGIKIAIDDFGTGYSSLAYLKRLPLDVLKIDRSFVAGLGHDQEDTAIIRAIISLAKSLDLAITGEGIETREQAALLGAWGCDCGQGFYYGKPLDSARTATLLRTAVHDKSRADVA